MDYIIVLQISIKYRKNDRIKSLYYHLNIYTRNTVELLARKDYLMEEIQNLKEKEEKLRITYEALLDETDNLFPADTVEELEENMQIPKAQIAIWLIGLEKLEIRCSLLRQH